MSGEGVSVAEQFKAAFREHPAGIALITATTPEGPVGLTASSVASVGLDPVALTFSVTRATGSAGALLLADTFLVHLLDARRTARQTDQEYLQALYDAQTARVELERAIGVGENE